MAQAEIRIPINITTLIAAILSLFLAFGGFLATPNPIPVWASAVFILMALLFISQLKSYVVHPDEIIVKTWITRKIQRISKAEITAILIDQSTNKRTRMITIRTASKKNLTISKANITGKELDKIISFFRQHYAKKLQ